MNNTNIIHTIIAAICGAFVAYFNVLVVPIVVMIVIMIIDYITGLAGAYVTNKINSRIGIIGIIKKVAYLGLVAVGMTADYIIYTALAEIGITIQLGYCVGMVIVIWLIINELISILENLAEIGVPLPNFITKIVNHLKNTVESKVDNTTE